MYETMRREYSRRSLLLGVDRLDYSKGLPHRVRAFRELLANYPENRRSATLIQIASPTPRGRRRLRRHPARARSRCAAPSTATTASSTGCRCATSTAWWRASACRACAARPPSALVTPLRDGMNLVAKEYIAAQDPADPGVLVLSRFAGAAEQLKEALLVNPYDTHGTAETRCSRRCRCRWKSAASATRSCWSRIREQDVHWWRRSFLDALRAAESVR